MNLTFTPVTPAAAPLLARFLPAFGSGGANHSVAALVTRAGEHETEFAVADDRLFVRWRPMPGTPRMWMMPMGKAPDAALMDWFDRCGRESDGALRFWGVVPEMEPVLAALFLGRDLRVTTSEDWQDYLYEREAMATLAGRALHGKRNFAKRFWAANPEAKVLPMTIDWLPACREFLAAWQAAHGAVTPGLAAEAEAIETAFSHWEALGLAGCVLLRAREVLGFSYGAMTSPDIFTVHIEKARRDVTGAYPALAQAMAKRLPPSVRLVNREEDLGILGLRKAKSDWAPCGKLVKGWVTVS